MYHPPKNPLVKKLGFENIPGDVGVVILKT